MENKNTMFGNEVSKKVVARDVRIREQAADFLTQYDKKTKALTEDAEQAKLDAAMSSARFGYASTAKRSADRVRMMNETIAYENNAATYGMTEMVAQVVESGLLLDESELSKILPTYKEDIRDTISGLLKEGRINSEITNPETLMLMEYVAKELPTVKDGRTLTEDDIASIVNKNKTLNIDMAIKNLGSNVGNKVSGLLEKEQKQKKDIENEVAAAKGKVDSDQNGKNDLAEIEQAIMSGDLTQADIDELLASGEISQKDYDQLAGALGQVEANGIQDPNAIGADPSMGGEMPPEGGNPAAMAPQDPNAMGADPSMGGEMPPEGGDPAAMAPQDPNAMGADPAMAGDMAPQAGVAPGMPKKQVQLLPDGTMNINVYENVLVRETPCTGLFESLAVNEARNMIKEGKEYDSDTCLAKAIMYVTITEAMNELGLINITENDYNRIITEAGGCCGDPKNRQRVVKALSKKSVKVPPKKEKGVVVKESAQLNEFCITSGPIMNKYTSDDMAERIRRRKLERLSEGSSGIINE